MDKVYDNLKVFLIWIKLSFLKAFQNKKTNSRQGLLDSFF